MDKAEVLDFLRDEITNDDNDMNARQYDVMVKRLASKSGLDSVVPIRETVEQLLPEKVSNKPLWSAVIVIALIALDSRFDLAGQVLVLLGG